MRIAKNTTITITEAPTVRFMLVVDVMDGDITLKKDGKLLLSLSLGESGAVCARIFTATEEITLCAENAAKKEVILTSSYARFGLYVNGVLTDEDFFFTPLDYLGAEITAGSFMHFEAGYEYHSMPESAIVENVSSSFDGFRPYGNGMALSHPIPSVIKDRLHVFYLDERRRGTVKGGMGANRLCALFSEDGEKICSAPIALPIDSVEEKRMADASPITVQGRTYLYYLVDYRGGRALSCAVSDDGFSYLKTGLDIDIPTVKNEDIASVCALFLNGDPHLLFTVGAKAYLAKSIDLLHFEAPKPLSFADGITNLSAFSSEGKVYYIGEKGEKTVYAEAEDTAWKPLPFAEKTRFVSFGGKLWAFGVKDGALSMQIAKL